MKLLWFSHFVPFPPRGGSFQRSYNLLRSIAKDHEVLLVAFNLEGLSAECLREYGDELRKHCARVEFWDLPVPWKSPRWWLGLGLSPFSKMPYASQCFWSPALAERWQSLLREFNPALLHVDSIDLAPYFPLLEGYRRVLHHHNCESAMADRRADKVSNPVARAYLKGQARRLGVLEVGWCGRFEVNVTVSAEDAQLLQSRARDAHVHVVDNGTDTGYWTPGCAPEEADSVVFAGSLRWYPNLSGMQFFIDRVWPRVRQLRPAARLYIAGRKPADQVLRWSRQDPSITVVPDPEDIRPWVARGTVMVCPILDGGGTRLKILDALAMGKAVVTTTIGCEGLHVRPEENILIADTAEDFAAAVLRLMENDSLRRRLGRAGRALVEEHYDWARLSDQLRQAYRCALDRRQCTLAAPPLSSVNVESPS